MIRFLLIGLLLVAGCVAPEAAEQPIPRPSIPERPEGARVLTAGFVITPQVFNSELMAPYDVFQHSIFRDESDYIETFVVSETGGPIETFEGILVTPHYSFADAPDIDILVIPSAGGSMTADLENAALLNWLGQAVEDADWVITVCDGAFPLAATGALNGRKATTFPADRQALQEQFPEVEVLFDQRIVVDGKFITSVGGAMSYEPAFYLVERLYGKQHADLTAEGLVWPWDITQVPMLEVP
ncbi:MAG: DJ-1/PfpI family protein [Rhodothermales bacterium]|nr:DJ-1/PfpI family protein [Rhodothermales bacterium]MBO6778934.1 DJ-1/PfpI family protein [Rhodothermales bacterium]